jgi:hydroxypyruvate isomerase
VAQAIDYAHALDCPRLNCLVGIPPAGVSPQLARETLIENLRFAAAACGKAGIQLLIEPLNTRDTPGFLISTTRAALQLIAAVGADQLKLQYDVYHAQVMEGDLAHTLEAHLPLIGHIQIADNPGRHEPGTGEINFPFLFRHLDAIGYTGWVGCEYKPRGATMDSLGWRAPA